MVEIGLPVDLFKLSSLNFCSVERKANTWRTSWLC